MPVASDAAGSKNVPIPADSFFIKHVAGIGVATVTIMMGLIATMFYWQAQNNRIGRDWVVHTYETIGHIQSFLGTLKDAELGERGYLVTGNDEYLEPYTEAQKDSEASMALPTSHFAKSGLNVAVEPNNLPAELIAIDQHLSIRQELTVLRWLTADNPAQQRNLTEMDAVLKDLLVNWGDMIRERKAADDITSGQDAGTRRGKTLMDHARVLGRIMIAEESRLLDIRTQADEETNTRNNYFIYGSMLLFYVGMMSSVWLAARHWRRAKRAEADTYAKAQQIARSNHELQENNQKLMDFTEELQRNEEELKTQQEELEVSNEEMQEKTRALEEQNTRIRRQSTELKDAKQLLEEKARELERSSKYKSEFLANMSHELRTPLNSLLILSKTLAANEDGNLTEQQIEEAGVIHSGGLELLNLINDILDLSKVEAGKISLFHEDVAFGQILQKLEQQFAPIARESGVAFHVALAQDLPPLLYTDTQRVEQILKNLLSNAFKFTQKGSVTLAVSRIGRQTNLQRATLSHDATVAFSVTDTGIGIDAAKFKDIFEAFQQEDGSIDRHYGGTGLGLTIARKFAHILGGEIHVKSSKGSGSTFTLLLPLKAAVAERAEALPPQSHMQPAGEVIALEITKAHVSEFIADDRKIIHEKDKVLLIIEDDKDFAAILVKIARKHGYKCLAAGDGKTGLLLATEYSVSAIILDLKLPDIDGVRILDQLKHDLRTRHIPVHIISGRDMADNILPLRKGAIGYLAKPAPKEALDAVFTKIERLLQSGMKKVLVVEDDSNAQRAMASLLKKKDIEITFCGNGGEALEQARATRFDCVILDLRLPDMTGFEWLEAISKEAAAQRGTDAELPPIIVYTAKELTEEENRHLSSMASSIVIKGAHSSERLLDEVTLFLHSVESTLSTDQQAIIRMQHNPDKMLQGRTVLLVDDDLRNTFALSKPLKKRGLNVVIADNGQMALEKLRQEKSIEVVIMDIMMPIMDGYQAMRAIRAKKIWQDIPIIALTARAMPEEQDKCMEAGANDYLTKPVDVERLLTLMRVWLFKQELAA